jgi:hypothetical protein
MARSFQSLSQDHLQLHVGAGSCNYDENFHGEFFSRLINQVAKIRLGDLDRQTILVPVLDLVVSNLSQGDLYTIFEPVANISGSA